MRTTKELDAIAELHNDDLKSGDGVKMGPRLVAAIRSLTSREFQYVVIKARELRAPKTIH